MKKMHLSVLVTLLLGYLALPAQDTLHLVHDSTSTLPLAGPYTINAAYEDWSVATTPFAFEHLTTSDFNQGFISDPSLLVQGRIAGTQIYNRGGDPNAEALFRVRGLSAISQRQPLFVIDGVPGAALESLDPNDVASITVLKDGASQALYGIRASNGVVLINTKSSQVAPGRLAITYSGQVASSVAHRSIAVTDATQFANEGGLNLGSSTVWMDEVQRTGLSQMHKLAVSGRTVKTNYRISGNYRNVEGILRKSGFEQLNLRGQLRTVLLRDKLRVQLTSSYTDRNSQFGFQEAFRYAVSHNPTAPVLAADAPFPFAGSRFGGYYELIGLFDAFNPRALIDLNDQYGQDQVFNGLALLQYDLLTNLKLNFRYAYQNHFVNERAYYSPQSLFRGSANSLNDSIRGRADLRDLDQRLSVYEFFINYGTSLGKSSLDFTLGSSYSDGTIEDHGLTLRGFREPSLLETQRIASYANWQDEANATVNTNNFDLVNRYAAFFGRFQYNLADQLFLHGALRTEGASRLGEDNQWGTFSAFGAAYDLGKKLRRWDLFKFRASYGITGAVPDRFGLSRELSSTTNVPGSPPITTIVRQANPNLRWEEKSELNLGLDVRAGRFQAYLEWYNRQVSDWVETLPEQFPEQYGNRNTLESTGIELGLDFTLIAKQDFTYQTGLRLATFRSVFGNLGGAVRDITSSCCNSADPIIAGLEGERVGELLAPVFAGVDEAEGFAIFTDLNGDGLINREASSAYEEASDLAVIGNGLPSLELGWTHRLHYRSWELSSLLRGAFGHRLFNVNRRFYESPLFGRNPYNYVNTELRIADLQNALYADIHVENASFLKLDFLTLARTFPLGNADRQQLRISLTAQNILLATNYTGADPEPSLEDFGSTDSGVEVDLNRRNPLAPGIDRRASYLPARTFTLGVSLSL